MPFRYPRKSDPEPVVVDVHYDHVLLSPGGTHYISPELLDWLDEQGIDFYHPVMWTGSFAIWNATHAAIFKLRWG